MKEREGIRERERERERESRVGEDRMRKRTAVDKIERRSLFIKANKNDEDRLNNL